MAERLTFTLSGRDELSRVLDGAGNSADRLRATMTDAADGSGRAILTLTQDADGRLRDLNGQFVSAAEAARLLAFHTDGLIRPTADWSRVADLGREAGDALKKALISLAPAAIPAAAALAPLAAATGAAAAAIGVYAAALGPQISAMGDAVDAEEKYQTAVEESGSSSKEAAQAQAAYGRQLAKMTPEARAAAAHMSVLKDTFREWSDDLAKDTLAPFTKGLALTSALLPKLTPLVQGTSTELDRMITLVGGGMASPGFDGLMVKFSHFSTGVLENVNESLIEFLRQLDTGEVGGGLRSFMDYARAQGPVVGETMRSVGDALGNILEAGSEVGVGLLQVVDVLAKLVAAVPPDAIALFLQLTIAVKALALATAGFAAAKALVAGFAAQMLAMRAAAAAAPGPLAAAGAAITTLSRTAKVAIAGTGIGLLVIALSELSQTSKPIPPDVDRLATSLGELGRTGQVTGLALDSFGADFGKLRDQINAVINPSVAESINNWGADISGGMLDAGEATEQFEASVGSIDQGLASLVAGGKADLAKASLESMLASMDPTQAEKLKGSLTEYDGAVANLKFEQDLTTQSMGIFGAQARDVQAKLDGQKRAADGLRQSIHALDQAHLIARGGVRGMEAAIDAASEAVAKNGATLDENTAKGRANNQALDDIANATQRAMEAKYEETGSWNAANEVYERGRGKLEALARQMGLDTDEARKLADQILATPDKTAKLRADKRDIEVKLAAAKKELARVPDSRKAAVRANIKQLEDALNRAEDQLEDIDGTTAVTYVKTVYTYSDQGARKQGSHGTQLKAKGGLVTGPGTGTSDDVPLMASNGEYVIRASSVSKYGLDMMRALNSGELDKAAIAGGRVGMAPAMGRPAAAGALVQPVHVQIDVSGALDPVATAKAIQKTLLTLKRHGGVNINLGVA